ncbi:hypothetical protein CU103_30120 [Phyllobacterium sophorae]|uniref:Uncharacterized protein n=1 Tax=Phyllobacterium sophorae TaxID=1520277 RepID=A0A2P7AQ24_9HYPH|nr:hypothetical protein CU103_30120 [Phyllobacterium sophorae]
MRGWQLHSLLIEDGYLPGATICCISGSTHKVQYHSENYYEPWNSYPISQPIHVALHRRFSQPEAWTAILEHHSVTGQEWFAQLQMTPVDFAAELRAAHGSQITRVFDRVLGRYRGPGQF